MSSPPKRSYEFGPFRADLEQRLLLRQGEIVPLTSKVFETLLVLIEHRDRVLEKEELMRLVWPDTVVEDNNLTVNISTLRKALGDNASERRYIVTVPGRGYRFAAEVREVFPAAEPSAKDAPPETIAATATTSGQRLGWKIWLSLVLVMALGGALLYYWQTRRKTGPLAGIKAIAVLPFKPLAATGRDDYIGLGVSDDLITRLSNIRQITVRPTSAMRRYLGQEKDAVTIGRELGVDAVLEGSIRQTDERIRVTVQLIQVSDGRPLWADKFDEQFTHIFAVQDSISEQVIRALTLQLSGQEQALVSKRFTENAEAYRLYLQGRYFWNKRTEEGFRKAIELFEQAIALDPGYARAYAGLADAYGLLASYNFLPPQQAYPKAKAAAEKAIALDGGLAEAHTSLASIQHSYEWDWRGAEQAYQRALELNPGYATAHQWYGEYLIQVGRFDEAAQQMELARALDPLSLIINTNLGWTFFMARNYDRAIAQLRKVVELDAHFVNARLKLGLAYMQKGLLDEAQAEFQQAQTLAGESSQVLSARACAYARAGARAEAQRIVKQLAVQARTSYVEPSDIALVYVALGQADEAFAWLQKAYAQRSEALLCWLKVDPRVDALRADPRFAELLRAVGL
jgi:TolB-like protein/DNA-binding winged helix-turn-helix (wHTH) protein/Flp pilus assembly protein TadD